MKVEDNPGLIVTGLPATASCSYVTAALIVALVAFSHTPDTPDTDWTAASICAGVPYEVLIPTLTCCDDDVFPAANWLAHEATNEA